MDSWFAGDFERCLQQCDAARLRDAESRTHVALLRARALMRLHRLDEALEALRNVQTTPDRPDETITARMLTGEAHVRSGDVRSGLPLLLSAQADAFRAHPTIRSEIALNIGLAHYTRHDFDAAEAALNGVADDTDLVYARSVQYRAWVAAARGNGERAVTLFTQALTALDGCTHQDRYFEANCVRALAHLGAERLDRQTWAYVSARRARIDWSFGALAQPRFFIAYCAAAYQLDVEGNPLESAREGRHVEDIAPGDAFRVQARCRRAFIARHVGERVSQRDHAESAADLFATLDPAVFTGDEKVVPLILCEELADILPDRARAVLSSHRELSPMSPMRLMSQSFMLEAYRCVVEARIHESSGDRNRAAQLYREAFEFYKGMGYTRRAVMAVLGLLRFTKDRKLIAYAAHATSHLSPRSWLRREVEAANSQTTRLTTVQRDVLALICQGKSNPDIARLRKRSLHTIRNLVARLFEIFDVTSREELAVEGVRRGLYTPK